MKKILITALFAVCIYIVLPAQPGALDSSFANGGKFTPPCKNFNCTTYLIGANAVVIQPDGKIIMAGDGSESDSIYANQGFAITRLNSDGTLDNSFSDNGVAIVNFSRPDTFAYAEGLDIAIQSDGKIVVVGYVNTYNFLDIGISRLNADGTPDESFGNHGKKLIDLSALIRDTSRTNYSYDIGTAVAIKPSGKICIAGDTYTPDSSFFMNYDGVVIQLNSNGQFDKSFGSGGIKILPKPSTDEGISKIVVQENNKLLLAGYTRVYDTASDFLTIRLNGDGTLDNGYGVNGFNQLDIGGIDYCSSMILQDDGKILLGGTQGYPTSYTASMALVRLNTNGSLDKSFNGSGIQIYTDSNSVNEAGKGLALQQDGKIVQTGRTISRIRHFYDYSGYYNFEVLRFNPHGTVDSNFGNRGRSIIDFGNWTDNVEDGSNDCAIQSDGKIIAAGYEKPSLFASNYYAAAVRLLVNGKQITLNAPPDQTVNASLGECTLAVNNIDPIINPEDANATVDYKLYVNSIAIDSGKGSVSGKQFNPGTTVVVYTLESNPLQRAVFSVTVNGTSGGALAFDGQDDRVILGTENWGYNGEYSFEAWINVRKYTNDDGQGSLIFGNERNDNGGIYVGLDSVGHVMTYHPNTGFVVSSYKVPLNTWTAIAFVQSTAQLDLYVNGNFIQTLLTAPNLYTQNYYDTSYLGAYTKDFQTYTRHFNGRMDEVRIWTNAICPAQVQNNLHCQIANNGNYPNNLEFYYKMNQGIADCNNSDITYLVSDAEYAFGALENFALNDTTSNWVEGYITDTCAPFQQLAINCPGDIVDTADAGQCGKIVNFEVTANSGCSPDVTLTYSQDPGTFFPAGETYVTVTATNGFGNQAQCSFRVIVRDPQPPVLVTKDTTFALSEYANVVIQPNDVIASLTDDCGIDPFFGVSVDPNPLDCHNAGPNIITVTATDLSGNVTTKTATVTLTPFNTTTSVEVSPAQPQYSDPASFTAFVHDLYYFFTTNGCIDSPKVTFKLDSKVLGTVIMDQDFFSGDLVGTLDSVILNDSAFGKGVQPGNAKVTAIFERTSDAIKFDTVTSTQFEIARENAGIDYVMSQLIKTGGSDIFTATIPVGAVIKDINDGFRGDIRNASVTFTIEPVTAGASIIGAGSFTVPNLLLVNSDHTSGIASGQFNVSIGPNNTRAKFQVIVKVGNYYIATLKVPVIVVRGSDNDAITKGTDPTSNTALGLSNAGFNVVAMPNPSHDYFNLKIESSSKYEKTSIRVLDVAGRVIESRTTSNVNETIRLGQHFIPGVYLVEVTQGKNKKVIKIVKQ
jgi:uncharacterized delta-60 repeat protein